jgi:hypothetical protein
MGFLLTDNRNSRPIWLLLPILKPQFMYDILLRIHSLTPYIFFVLIIIVLAMAIGGQSKNRYTVVQRSLGLITMILAHVQLLFGLLLLAFGDYARAAFAQGMSLVMQDAEIRLRLIEHPLTMLIAVALITIGYSRSKRVVNPKAKNRSILIFYGLGIVLILIRLPYAAWFNL